MTRASEKERATTACISDAVIIADASGLVTFLNPVAQSLTGWTPQEAMGVPLESVFKIVHEESRQSVESPAARTLREGVVVGVPNRTLLVATDGTERPIDGSASPIRTEGGEVTGGRSGLSGQHRTQAARASGAECPQLRQ